ncbi:hypothetical protein RUND412_007183 [Rhizina undulata]
MEIDITRPGLNALPYDITVEILHCVENFGCLFNLILTSKNFHNAWVENQLGICNSVIRREVFPLREALAVYFLTEYNDERVLFPPEEEPFCLNTYRISLPCVQSLLQTSQLIQKVREEFQLHHVSIAATTPKPETAMSGSQSDLGNSRQIGFKLSSSETARFNKAFYQLLYFASYRLNPMKPNRPPNATVATMNRSRKHRFISTLSLPDLLVMDTIIFFIYRHASFASRDRDFLGNKFHWGMFYFVDVHSTYSSELRRRLGDGFIIIEAFVPGNEAVAVLDSSSGILEELGEKEKVARATRGLLMSGA